MEIGVEVDRLMEPWTSTSVAGASVGVVLHGEVVHAKGYGMANLEHAIPNGADTVFRLDSTSKQFTAYAIAHLEHEGQLDHEAEVRAWFPEVAPGITVGDLVHHTSGIRDCYQLVHAAGRTPESFQSLDDVLRLLGRQQAGSFEPGSRFEYSNSNYLLLAELVPRVSGRSLRELLQAEVFGPLQMTDTHVHDDRTEIVPRRATGYQPTPEGVRIHETWLELVGDGGVFSTIDDQLRWEQFVQEQHAAGAPLHRRVLTPGRRADGTLTTYAYGLQLGTKDGIATVFHGGAWVGFRSIVVRVPERALSIVVCGNSGDLPLDLAGSLAETFLRDGAPPPAAAPARAGAGAPRREDVVGSWEEPERGLVLTIEDDGSRLLLRIADEVIPLLEVEGDALRADAPNLQMDFGWEAGTLVAQGGGLHLPLQRVSAAPEPEALARWVGRFHSAELQAVYDVALADGDLTWTIADSRSTGLGRLTPRGLNLTLGSTARDEDPTSTVVQRFALDVPAAAGVRFVRVE